MPFATTGTIAAIATAIVPQQGSVGIVRASGSEALDIAKKLFHAPGKQVWESHRILYGYIRHPQTQELVDEVLLLIMQAPRSYTRFGCGGVSLSWRNYGSAASVTVVFRSRRPSCTTRRVYTTRVFKWVPKERGNKKITRAAMTEYVKICM